MITVKLKKPNIHTLADDIRASGQERIIGMMLRVLRGSSIGIVRALEAKDEYSQKHSERVAEMSRRFSALLGNSDVLTEQIFLAGTAHDIGKIGIPDSVLLEPGRLSDEQWERMQTHPSIGAQILDRSAEDMKNYLHDDGVFIPVPSILLEVIQSLRDGILHHHEKWNGTGYPDGLAEEDIPYISRVIALCDSTDAMMSKRVYRSALSAETCKEEIARNRGIMYDPRLTDVFLEHFDEIIGDIYDNLVP